MHHQSLGDLPEDVAEDLRDLAGAAVAPGHHLGAGAGRHDPRSGRGAGAVRARAGVRGAAEGVPRPGSRPAVRGGESIVVVSQQSARLQELLAERNVEIAPTVRLPAEWEGSHAKGRLALVHGSLPEGWRCEALGLSVYTDGELFGWRKVRRPVRQARSAARDAFLSDLQPGELVVHVDHGIGRFRGLYRTGGTESRRTAAAGQRDARVPADRVRRRRPAVRPERAGRPRHPLRRRRRRVAEPDPAGHPGVEPGQGAEPAGPSATSRRTWWSCTPPASWPTATPSRRTPPGSTSSRTASRTSRRRTS